MSRGKRPLLVVALGGNAISPPAGALSIAEEREVIARTLEEIAPLGSAGARLLLVHGNGPQVGRLLAAPGIGDATSLDVHVAQTQGELGYLLAEGLEARLGGEPCAALVTRAVVDARDPAFESPRKPVGAVLAAPIPGLACARTPDGRGWRRVVASPRPLSIVEGEAIRTLLATHHVVAGGGGGVPLAASGAGRTPCAAVIDKDWVAALLATSLGAEELLFVTDVPHAFDRFGQDGQRPIAAMRAHEARERIAAGVFSPGSMQPKVASAVEFVEASGRRAVIAMPGEIERARRGRTGTTVTP
jgi:carbamate kinase